MLFPSSLVSLSFSTPSLLFTIFPLFWCSCLPAPSVPLCAFHPSVFCSVSPTHTHIFPSLLSLVLPSSYPIPFLFSMVPWSLSAAGYRFALQTPAALFFLRCSKCFRSAVEIDGAAEQKDLFILAVGWRLTVLLAREVSPQVAAMSTYSHLTSVSSGPHPCPESGGGSLMVSKLLWVYLETPSLFSFVPNSHLSCCKTGVIGAGN